MKLDKLHILNKIKDHYNIKKDAEFARFLGITTANMYTWIKRSTYDASTILAKCPDISAEWLLTGEGEMLKEKPSCQPTSTTSDENILINKLLDMIAKQQETIERQQKSIEDLTALLSKQIVVDKSTEAEAAKCAIAG